MASIHQNELEPMSSWATAAGNSKGYEAYDLVKDLTQQFEQSLGARRHLNENSFLELTVRRAHLISAWTYFLARTAKSEICVCDVGGGNGYMFDWITQHQGLEDNEILNAKRESLCVNWNVFESEAIADAYQNSKGSLPINFIANRETNYPNEIDFSLLSCFIQYVDEWRELLDTIGKKSEYLLLMRLPLIDSPNHREFVQHFFSDVYGRSQASWPIRLFSEIEFMKFISERFVVIYSGSDPEETIPFEGKDYPLRTLFLKRK